LKPKILITGSSLETENGDATYVGKAYTEAIVSVGGIPLILPLTDKRQEQHKCSIIDKDWLAGFDGLMLTGGEDIDPLLYGKNPHRKLGRIAPDRDIVEMAIIPLALSVNMPIFGICRGMQVLNVACGGTLYQDIYSQASGIMQHRQNAPRNHSTHGVNITKNSRLHKIFKSKYIYVNSYHHQAIDKIADGFIVSAQADDGIIEAIETVDGTFVIAVQWHPEGMWEQIDKQYLLFESFVKECQSI
jgi:putative glutamine amidotransferase